LKILGLPNPHHVWGALSHQHVQRGHTRTRHDAKLAVKGQDKKFKTQWSTGPIPTGISFLPIEHTD
jgi:hypothetical protein